MISRSSSSTKAVGLLIKHFAFAVALVVGLLLTQGARASQEDPKASSTAGSSPSSVEERLDAAFATKGKAKRYGEITSVFQDLKLEEIRPALAFVRRMGEAPSQVDIRSCYHALFDRWASLVDPKTVLPEAQKIEQSTFRNAAETAVIRRWAYKEPKAAFEYVMTLQGGDRRDLLASAVLHTWASSDRDAAIKAIETTGSGKLAAKDMGDLISLLLPQSPERALDIWLSAAPRSPGKSGTYDAAPTAFSVSGGTGLETIFSAMSNRDPSGAIERAKKLGRDDWKEVAMTGVAQGWAQRDPAAAFEWFQKEGALNMQSARTIFRVWSGYSPKAASVKAATLNPGLLDEVAPIIVEPWSRLDRDAALAWARSLPPGPAIDNAIAQIIVQQADSQPRVAAEEALKLASGPARDRAIEQVAVSWIAVDAKAATDWVEKLPDAGERARAIYRMVEAWARRNPEAAASYVRGLSDPELRRNTIVAVISVWAQRNYRAAGVWLQTLPPNDFEGEVAHFIELWSRRDPDETLAWVKALPAGNARDAAVVAVCSSVDKTHVNETLALAQKISDEDRRLAAMTDVMRKWFAVDPDAAGVWITKSDLSADTKRRLFSAAK